MVSSANFSVPRLLIEPPALTVERVVASPFHAIGQGATSTIGEPVRVPVSFQRYRWFVAFCEPTPLRFLVTLPEVRLRCPYRRRGDRRLDRVLRGAGSDPVRQVLAGSHGHQFDGLRAGMDGSGNRLRVRTARIVIIGQDQNVLAGQI